MKHTFFCISILAMAGTACALPTSRTNPGPSAAKMPEERSLESVLPREKPPQDMRIVDTLKGRQGLVALDIQAIEWKGAKATAATHRYKPGQGPFLMIEKDSAFPPAVGPGQEIKGTVQYALLGGGPDGTFVTETRELMRGDKIVGISTHKAKRPDGTWITSQDIQIPENMPPGEYRLIQRIETPREKMAGTSTFRINETMARVMPEEQYPRSMATVRHEFESRASLFPPGYGPNSHD